MEFYQELLLTAVISVLLAFLVGKLAALGSDGDDLDQGSPEKVSVPADGGGAVRIEEKRVRFREGSGLEGGAEAVGEICEESVGDGCGAGEVVGSDPTEVNEVVDDDGMDEEKPLEAVACEPDLEEENRVDKRSEVNDARLEVGFVKETSEAVEIERVDAELAGDGVEMEIAQSTETELVQESEVEGVQRSSIDEEVGKVGSLLHGEDEWEGIERSGLETLFGVATAYVRSASGGEALSRLNSNVQMQLYGLHKVAMEGPCYEPQPLALKVSARAKWHAWQRLGNMNPEVAMEQYITLLSDSIPGWRGEKPGGDAKQDEGNDPPREEVFGTGTPDSGSSFHSQLSSKIEREPEDSSCVEGGTASVVPKLSEQGLTKTFFLNLLSPTTVRFLSFYW